MNLAAAAGGTAANVALNRLQQWWSQPAQQVVPMSPYSMAPLVQALPSNTQRVRGRGRGRRGRARRRTQAGSRSGGQPSSGIHTQSGTVVVIRDTEVLGAVGNTLKTYEFNPSVTETPRLNAHEAMYRRFRIRYFNIAYKSGSGTATEGNVAVGVAVGPKMADVKDQDTILKLRPSFYVPSWKNDSITVGGDIDLSRYMLCSDMSADGIAFTLYVMSSKASTGMIQVSYEVEFSHPRPFH